MNRLRQFIFLLVVVPFVAALVLALGVTSAAMIFRLALWNPWAALGMAWLVICIGMVFSPPPAPTPEQP
jgi:hypothetical protein